MQLSTSQKKILGPVHLHPKMDKWDYLRSPIMKKKKMFLVLTSGKFLEPLGSGIGSGSIFCLSFSLSNRVASFLAFSAAFLAIISRFHLGISTPLGSWLGTYKDFLSVFICPYHPHGVSLPTRSPGFIMYIKFIM